MCVKNLPEFFPLHLTQNVLKIQNGYDLKIGRSRRSFCEKEKNLHTLQKHTTLLVMCNILITSQAIQSLF